MGLEIETLSTRRVVGEAMWRAPEAIVELPDGRVLPISEHRMGSARIVVPKGKEIPLRVARELGLAAEGVDAPPAPPEPSPAQLRREAENGYKPLAQRTRDELNAIAELLGIEGATGMDNKGTVLDAIKAVAGYDADQLREIATGLGLTDIPEGAEVAELLEAIQAVIEAEL